MEPNTGISPLAMMQDKPGALVGRAPPKAAIPFWSMGLKGEMSEGVHASGIKKRREGNGA